jgi:cysteine desulfurase
MNTMYFDNSATTKISKEVLDSMMAYLTEKYGNPSSIYSLGRESKKGIDDSRDRIAKALGCESKEIYFTNSGTESDNWAIKGVAFANKNKGNHIITSSIEHHAVLHTCKYLEKHGFEITYLPVQSNGIVDINKLKEAIREDTILISIMWANNEIGTIQPIKEIGDIAKEKGIYFHTDAVQAVGNIDIDLSKHNIDLLSFSGHKLNGPKGIGVLYIKDGVKIDNLLHGGGQERGKRASTENVASIVGLGTAVEFATKDIEKKSEYLIRLREKCIGGILDKIPETIVNGDRSKRLPGNVNVCFKYIEGESILLMLDQLGICASSGSACTSGSLDPSHVLLAIGLPHEIAHGSLRLSFSKDNTEKEIDYLLEVLPDIVNKLRNMSPLWKTTVKK